MPASEIVSPCETKLVMIGVAPGAIEDVRRTVVVVAPKEVSIVFATLAENAFWRTLVSRNVMGSLQYDLLSLALRIAAIFLAWNGRSD
jgi:hypothetical protein